MCTHTSAHTALTRGFCSTHKKYLPCVLNAGLITWSLWISLAPKFQTEQGRRLQTVGISSARSQRCAKPFAVPLEIPAVASTAPWSQESWLTWKVPSVRSRLHRPARMLQSTAEPDPNSRWSVREKIYYLSDKYHREKKNHIFCVWNCVINRILLLKPPSSPVLEVTNPDIIIHHANKIENLMSVIIEP